MSSGPDNVTQTTRTEPSPLLTPGISTAASSALQQFNPQVAQTNTPGGYDFYRNNPDPNVTLVPPTPGAVDLLEQRGREGSPLVGEGTDLVSRTLGGEFLTPDSNPFLADTFNRAADLTRTRLDSEFAGAGRNLGAALPARSEELQTLAANIYGPAYAQERQLQQGALSSVLPFAQNDFTDINAILDSENLPLDTLINRIGALAPAAGGTAVSTQPLQRNSLAGGLGGAGSGFMLGNALFPGVGGAVGAGLGGLIGLLG